MSFIVFTKDKHLVVKRARRFERAAEHLGHMFDTRLQCDGREHYYPCVLEGCNARRYFCKHLEDDRHCPRSPPTVKTG